MAIADVHLHFSLNFILLLSITQSFEFPHPFHKDLIMDEKRLLKRMNGSDVRIQMSTKKE